jgi:YVTN family beta-propeller protein
MKQLHFLFFVALCSILSFTACNPDDSKPQGGAYSNGYFVVCEGTFGNNNGEISFIDNTGKVTAQAFNAANNRVLGDVVQSFTIIDDLAFIVVNGSQKVEVVDAKSFVSKKTIADERFTFPRYVQKLNDNQILLTNGTGYGDNFVFVLNSKTFEIEKSIATGAGPNQMILHNNRIFVANSGGYGSNNTITVINAETLVVEKTITVGDMPMSMSLDKYGNILVLCKGLTTYDENQPPTIVSNSKIVKLNTTALTAEDVYVYDRQILNFSSNLIAYDNATLYILDDDGVYSLKNGETSPQLFISGNFYGISIIGSNIWLCSNSSTNPHVVQYSLSGSKIADYKTSQMPNAVVATK